MRCRLLLRQIHSNIQHYFPSKTLTHPNPHSSNQPVIPKHNPSAIDSDLLNWNKSITAHMRNGSCESALEVFNSMPRRDTISYNAMLSGYISNGHLDLARELFDEMPQRDLCSWNLMLGGYVMNKDLTAARLLFDTMPERNVVSWTSMLSGYAQNGFVNEAREIFDKMPSKDAMSWNTMISGYVQNQMLDEARSTFDLMPVKDSVSWNAMIIGYVQYKRMDIAQELFELMPVKDIRSWNTMITGYSKIGDIAQARSLFNRMPQRDSVSWTSMIAGYVKNGGNKEAMHLFVEMRRDDQRLEGQSLSSALTASGNILALKSGKQLHGLLVKTGFRTKFNVDNTLLAMYCKCGKMDEARDVFQEISDKDLTSWNNMIRGYTRHGFGKEAVMVFESMKAIGVKPDNATMVAVLSACRHAGLVEKGTEYFYSMTQDYGITANLLHYEFMLDFLHQAGHLKKALKLLRNMPFKPEARKWRDKLYGIRNRSKAVSKKEP